MKNDSEIRVCKKKECQKVLPAGYKYKYCEACRNQYAHTAKNALGLISGIAIMVIPMVITGGKINSEK